MNLASRAFIKNLLKRYGLKPKKHLGQNFLIDRAAIRQIIAAADLKPRDVVLEVGPGLGVLTRELAKRAKRVIAVEKDPNLANFLDKELRTAKLKIIRGDILKILNSDLLTLDSYNKVVGNLPFYLTASLVREFLEGAEKRPLKMILVVQKEVAQRICSKPPHMGLLAVSVQLYSGPKIISYISKKAFWPQPEVDAAIVSVPITKYKLQKINKDLFFEIVRAGFSRPRKQLANNLSKCWGIRKPEIRSWLQKNNIQPDQRAEALSLADWKKLTKSFAAPTKLLY